MQDKHPKLLCKCTDVLNLVGSKADTGDNTPGNSSNSFFTYAPAILWKNIEPSGWYPKHTGSATVVKQENGV
jgi:hypothetical protein